MMSALSIIILPIINFNAPYICRRVALPAYIRLLTPIRILLPDILLFPSESDRRSLVVGKLCDHMHTVVVLREVRVGRGARLETQGVSHRFFV